MTILLKKPDKRQRLLLLLCLLLLAPGGMAQRIITSGEFLGATARIRTQVKKIIRREFSNQQKNLELLKNPYKIGDYITVHIRRGNHYEPLKGRFSGIIGGNYAKISNRPILLRDIAPSDRDRIIWNNDPKKQEKLLAERTQTLTEEIAKRERQLLKQEFNQAGYTTQFFKQHILKSEFIVPISRLGHRKNLLQAIIEEKDDFVQVTALNRSGQILDAVILLGQKPVATSISNGEKGPVGEWQNSFQFYLKRDELGENPMVALVRNLRILCRNGKLGTWELKLFSRVKRRTAEVERYGDVRTIKKLTFLCVLPDNAIQKATDPFSLRTIRKIKQVNFVTMAKQALEYQQSLQKIREILTKRRQTAWEMAKKAREATRPLTAPQPKTTALSSPPAEKAATPETPTGGKNTPPSIPVKKATESATETEEKDILSLVKRTDLPFTWLHTGDAPVKFLNDQIKILANIKMDNSESPQKIGNDGDVLYYTKWKRIRTRRRNQTDLQLDFPSYRFLIAKEEKGPTLYLQYAGMFTCFKETVQTVYVCFQFKNGDQPVQQQFVPLQIPPKWSGKLYLSNKIKLEQITTPWSDIKIKVLDSPPEPPAEPKKHKQSPPPGDQPSKDQPGEQTLF